ncbi:SIR2 family NAD-dependent protein deacylase [Nesterenkonia natronophila]|uniref:NAD-dependent protein deacylase n=1 Tax=Nesterenkonia natronophila TaxID=2174932 RepID=A0A3A4F4S2_9MICC|nr:NAD-dependent deacylase [Nesterenkonia natronophila]RJN32878.1 NAD-dependent deacylase [Nesterenkonia natronophila]
MQVLSHVTDELTDLIRSATRVAVLSGAGISAESGVPTFREAQTGLWEQFSAEDLATSDAFHFAPALVWTWYRWRQSLILQVEPNPGHTALARWQQGLRAAGGDLSIATQNVDDLHERAGAHVLAHLHGSIFDHRCAECGEPAELPVPGYDGFAAPPEPEDPPTCTACGALVRPGVVWFGEMLPMEAFDAASAAVRSADVVVVAGTSGIVQPAASLPLLALERGTPLIEINPVESDISDAMDYCLRGPSGTMLPALADAAL